jgi:imidazolonepropionase-like amidohydrolase
MVMSSNDSRAKPVLIKAGRLADGVTGTSRTDWAVLVTAGSIRALGPQAEIARQVPPDSKVIDLGGACLTPGLCDTHTHLSLAGDGRCYSDQFAETDEMMVLIGVMNLGKHLRSGVTTLCEHGARNRVGFALKEGLRRGYYQGPRMLVSGRPITCTGGHFHMCGEVADGEEAIRQSVRRLVHEGADYIKIMASGGGTPGTLPGRASYSIAELHAAVHEAHHFGRLTVAHCRGRRVDASGC